MYGGYDILRAQADQTLDADWLCFTDHDIDAPEPWKVIVEAPRYKEPRMAAKFYKTQPSALGYDDVVWLDANMQVTSAEFLAGALASRHDGIAAWKHPQRDDIYTEFDASKALEKYRGSRMVSQIARYRGEGHPAKGGLYACGTIAWDATDQRALTFGDAWLDECEQFSPQDQLSFPVVARRLGMRPGTFPVHQLGDRRPPRGSPWAFENDWLRIYPHLSER